MNKNLLILAAACLLTLAALTSWAQEENEELDYAMGDVVSINNESIVIMAYDEENDQEAQLSVAINENTLFDNVESAAEIAVGDYVEVYYKMVESKPVAEIIAKFDEEMDEGTIDSEEPEEMEGTLEDNG